MPAACRAQPAAWNSAARSPFSPSLPKETAAMTITIAHIQPLVAMIAGILILLVPRLLNYIVAIYLIVIGIIGLGVFR
jgi:hypothetical protein